MRTSCQNTHLYSSMFQNKRSERTRSVNQIERCKWIIKRNDFAQLYFLQLHLSYAVDVFQRTSHKKR